VIAHVGDVWLRRTRRCYLCLVPIPADRAVYLAAVAQYLCEGECARRANAVREEWWTHTVRKRRAELLERLRALRGTPPEDVALYLRGHADRPRADSFTLDTIPPPRWR
jgi:hypothetical protein